MRSFFYLLKDERCEKWNVKPFFFFELHYYLGVIGLKLSSESTDKAKIQSQLKLYVQTISPNWVDDVLTETKPLSISVC